MKSNTGTVCYPFPYSAVDGCLYMEKANKNGTATRKLCNFLPYLKCDINVDDGVEQTRTFRIAGIHESGRSLLEIEVTVKEFGKMDWVLERWGAECIIEPGKAEMKQTVDLIEEIVKEGQISNANLRQLIDKIIIYENGDGLRIQINLNAAFTEHMTIFGDDGNELADLQVVENKYPLPMRRRMNFGE